MKEIINHFKKNSSTRYEYLHKLLVEYNTRVGEYIEVRKKFSVMEESFILNYIGQLEDEIERVKKSK